ncbi:uncharacterized protein LOC123536910 isoform X2 [Mercenaria mercenaria]|uniref:uncharacterized protein LOC123536910 isoform X2 n=1 Tax=Mercenaria mercenaria TaxID=6596 RepID=UPI00234E819A|nr:uncharacterized protein LOC123536910 isoform X2 [Mercenaria mercenaria]
MQYQDNPYAMSLVNKYRPDNFNTTYGTSYMKVPTFQVSPAYEPFREPERPGRWFPQDLNPYPSARDESSIRNKKPYQQMSYYEQEQLERMQKEREYRARSEEDTPRRDEYREPPPGNMQQYYQEQQYEGQKGHHQERGHQQERGRPQERMRDVRSEHLRAQYDDLVVDGQSADPHDHRKCMCHKCFKPDVCMNKLGCAHQFCDECMSMMPGSDGPFRDSIRWHYCCDLCRKWTPESKLIRTDPIGRRMGFRPSSR